jgi:hypothetical protein
VRDPVMSGPTRPASAVVRAFCAKRISLEHAITLSILFIGFLSGTVGLAYAYWHAKESLHTTLGLNFRELARQSADKVGVVLAREIEWVERLGELSSLGFNTGGTSNVNIFVPLSS